MASKTTVKPKMEKKHAELVKELNSAKKAKLKELEKIIDQNLLAFQEVGMALKHIRDKNLFRPQYRNFDAYCHDRWGMGKNYAYKQIAAAKVIGNLGTNVHTLPLNEAQTRPLSHIEKPEDQRKVWNQIVDSKPKGGITSQHISTAVLDFRGRKPKSKIDRFDLLRKMLDKYFDGPRDVSSEVYYEDDEFVEKTTITASYTYRRKVNDEDDSGARTPMMIELN